MTTGVSVFLTSHNKCSYVLDALQSVWNQVREDWELWLLENSTDEGRTRCIIDDWLVDKGYEGDPRLHYEVLDDVPRDGSVYVTTWLLNQYYPRANGDHVFFLADDDVIDPDCFKAMAGVLDDNPAISAVYAGMRHLTVCQPGDVTAGDIGIGADVVRGPDAVDCCIDGGQVMHRKSCLDKLTQPYFHELLDPTVTRHCDGIFLKRIAEHFPFYPIPRYLVTHRFTPSSTWTPG
jgi:glycosyltransferase involved in cell wall biosynthesis